ncbi:MAG: hypothetical protein AAFP19_04390 [Bacteroidota bacterium]
MRYLLIPALFCLFYSASWAQSSLNDIKQLIEKEDFTEADKRISDVLDREEDLAPGDLAQWHYYQGFVHARLFFSQIDQDNTNITDTHLEIAIDGFNKAYETGQPDIQLRALKFLDGLYVFLADLSRTAYRESKNTRFFHYSRWASYCHLYVCRESVNLGWSYSFNENMLLLTAHGAELCGQKEVALDWYLRLIETGTKNVQVYRNASRLYEGNGDLDNALSIIDFGILKYPNAKDIFQLKLDLLLRHRRFDTLIKECQKGITRFPEDKARFYQIIGNAQDQACIDVIPSERNLQMGLDGKHLSHKGLAITFPTVKPLG